MFLPTGKWCSLCWSQKMGFIDLRTKNVRQVNRYEGV
jgi:hypothetical protein